MEGQRGTTSVAPPWAALLAGAVIVVSFAGLVAIGMSMLRDGTFFDDVVGESALLTAFGVYIVVGAMLLWRRPRHPVAWIMCGVGVAIGVGGGAQAYADFAIAGRSDPLAGGLAAAWIANWYWYVLVTLIITFVPLFFPTGRLSSRRWRPVLVAGVAAIVVAVVIGSLDPVFGGGIYRYTIVNPLGVQAVTDVEESLLGDLLLALVTGSAVAACASLVVRFRRARNVERAQIKWVAYAMSLVVAETVVDLVDEVVPALTIPSDLLFSVSFAAVPVSIAVAVLRHRLYDIDRLISRTISYGVVTALLVTTYLLLVVALQEALPVRGDLAVAASTLAVAALFSPLRRRVQTVVDRRFNRGRYDAARTIDAFAQRQRNQVDLHALTDDLETVAAETMQPSFVSLWLRSVR